MVLRNKSMRDFKMSKILRFGLVDLLCFTYPTIESKSAFQIPNPKSTENDVKFHKPPSKNDVPLAFQKMVL